MKEKMKIECLENSTANILVFRMMCQKAKNEGKQFHVAEYFNIPPEDDNMVDVKITINGIEVDPIECLETCWKHLDNSFEDRARDFALSLISLAGLNQLQDKINQAEQEISDAIDKAFEQFKSQNE